VGTVSGCALPVLAELLAGFHDRHPGVAIALVEDNSDRLVELAGRGLGLAVVPASIPNGPGILRITDPQLTSRLELAWRCAPAANPAARALIEQARALGPPGRSVP
jgi:DNA-binding transcriptional LysR family regulator